jgi:predicted HAD superfamily Cof-like phosphohydrolase
MTHTYQDVEDFHTKYQVPISDKLILLAPDELAFRIKFMQEELDEFVKANEEGNLEEAIDALIDLVYVAHGTASFMGIRTEQWQEHWDEVQNANLKKIMVESAADSKRGYKFDIKKPTGWEKPNHAPIIEKYLKQGE